MPGSGKSTVGVVLAKTLALNFIDTDIQLQIQIGQSLQSFIDERGYRAMRAAEEICLLNLTLDDSVLATGGSVIYSERAMHHLAARSRIVFLDVSFQTMLDRLGDFSARGIASDIAGGLEELYAERRPLYQQAAHHTIHADQPVMALVDRLVEVCREWDEGNA